MRDSELLKILEQWFQYKGWNPFPFQRKTWKSFLQGKHGMLNAPTGSGKTYALWGAIALEYLRITQQKKLPKGLKAIWITPLRALTQEIKQATEKMVEDLQLPLTVDIRTGDTTTRQRQQQKKQMPDLLITTPESLHLILASKGYQKKVGGLLAVVVDEWHELMGSKRGVQVELALSRLRALNNEVRTWGISATIGNLDQAREVLLGPGSVALQNSVLIKANINKKISVKSLIPEKMETFPWRGHLGLRLIHQVVPIIKSSKTTLLFTNTRSQCEIWFQRLLEFEPDLAGELAMHHGSIDRETRIWVEEAIRQERLKAVVCTSSLDLGVDFAPVETIIQIGGPKGVARFLQRAGRSGHQPGKESNIFFLPTHAMELIEASALREAVKNTQVEDRVPYLNSFDVLVQYLVTLAVSEGFYPPQIFEEIKQTFCYQGITAQQWQWVLNFITLGSQALAAYDEYKKVEIGPHGKFIVSNRGVAMRHRLQMGTIVGDADIQVKFQNGKSLGSIEETFITKLQPGDAFTFAGRNLELIRLRESQAQVKVTRRKDVKVSTWMGGRASFSARMSDLLRQELHKVGDHSLKTPELKALAPIFERQCKESLVPKPHQLLIESFKTREGYHTLVYPFEGRFVHEAIGSLLAYRISLIFPITFSIAYNDYGFELLSDQPVDMEAVLENDLITTIDLVDDLYKSINSTEMARRSFRDIAIISGLVFTGFPRRHIKMKHLQSNSQLFFDVFRDYEDDNLLYQQAYVESFEHQLELEHFISAMHRIAEQEIIWKQCTKPTPFSFSDYH